MSDVEMETKNENTLSDDEQLEMDDPEDEIVATYDVFMNQRLNGFLHLLQFPTRTVPLTEHHVTGQFKPQAKQLKFNVALDPDSQFYNVDVGERLAAGTARGDLANAFDAFMQSRQADLLKTQPFTSTKVANQANYMAAVYDKGTWFISLLVKDVDSIL